MILGIDEAGRGPLAGSVIAAGVILDPKNPIDGLMDSKKLTAKKRESLYEVIQQKALAFAIAQSTPKEIDEINILQATLLAMRRVADKIMLPFTEVLVDGNQLPNWNYNATAIIKGDSQIAEISAASILAKVYRDRQMVQYDKQYPHYQFARHKGYPTKLHLQLLQEYGALDIHRKSFAPVAKVLSKG
ncbi:ribonuclease HII [Facilibium subflavum]|uniref:ribonuclease HII n=1 Tax=Facilibium subflavum TaxID=2219058 RepID=UPI000E6523D2|nr:ribonuclease HII [Facilibium subflavum]